MKCTHPWNKDIIAIASKKIFVKWGKALKVEMSMCIQYTHTRNIHTYTHRDRQTVHNSTKVKPKAVLTDSFSLFVPSKVPHDCSTPHIHTHFLLNKGSTTLIFSDMSRGTYFINYFLPSVSSIEMLTLICPFSEQSNGHSLKILSILLWSRITFGLMTIYIYYLQYSQ